MRRSSPVYQPVLVIYLIVLLSPFTGEIAAAQTKGRDGKKDEASAITEAELQAQVMSFADRYSAIISSATREYFARSPVSANRRPVHAQLVYSIADAFTIAAGPDPVAALLDMVVMVTLGRMVFEEHYTQKYGSEVEPLVNGFQRAEQDIWQVAARVLNDQQQLELKALIADWRRSNPDVVIFSLLRFSDFEGVRTKSGASKAKTSSGLFQSVAKATAQVEEARLLAERGMYLGTRMPLLTGAFANVWASSLAVNPEVKEVLSDLNHVSEVSGRLADIAEDLPNMIAAERRAAIKQVMQEVAVERRSAIDQLVDQISKERERTIDNLVEKVATERRRTIEEFIAEEKRIRGLLTDLKQTLAAGNEALVLTNTLVERLNLGRNDGGAADPSKPFDIKDYQATLQEASGTISQIHDLVRTLDQMGLEKTLPLISSAFERAEAKGTEWVLQAFMLGVLLILILLAGAVFAMVLYRYMAHRMFQTDQTNRAS